MILKFSVPPATVTLIALLFSFFCNGYVSEAFAVRNSDAVSKVKDNYNKYLKANPDAGEKPIYTSLKKKQYEEAIQQCEKLRVIRPDDNDVYLLEGFAYLQKKAYSVSTDRFSHIIESDKSRGDAYYLRAGNYLRAGENENALNDITSALNNIETSPQLVKFYKGLGHEKISTQNIIGFLYYQKAVAHHRLGELQAAMDGINKAIEYGIDDGVYKLRGDVYLNQQKYTLAYKDYEKVIEVFPNYFRAWNSMGIINFIRGNYGNSITQYKKASELNPEDMTVLMNMSLSYWLMGNQEKAFETMEKVLKEKQDPNAFYHFAYFQHLSGDQVEALSNFKKARELNPDVLKMRTTIMNRAPESSPTRRFYQDQLKTAKIYIETEKIPITITNENRTPTIDIMNLSLTPTPVPVNKPFDIRIKFKADIPGSKEGDLSTLFYFKISQNNQVLYEAKPKTISAGNGKIESWTEHMNPVPVTGIYHIQAFVKYKEHLAEKSIGLTIQ